MASRSDGRGTTARPDSAPVRGKVRSDALMRDRFYYIVHTCMDRNVPVTLTTCAGDKYTGLLHTIVKEGVKLTKCKKVGSELSEEMRGFTDLQTLEFTIEEGEERPVGLKFKSDAQISKAKAPGRRELQKYAPETPVEPTHVLDDHGEAGKFDQFETNKKLFGVNATYNEDQYTTPLVKPEELTLAQIRLTEQIMKAIGRGEALDDAGGEMEEEERFAAVKGTGRFGGIKPVLGNHELVKEKTSKVALEEERKTESSKPSLTYSTGAIPASSRTDKIEKDSSLSDQKKYRKLRESLISGKRLQSELLGNATNIEALLLEPALFKNDTVMDNFEEFKKKNAEKGSAGKVKEQLKDFKKEFERKSASRKNSLIDTSSQGRKTEEVKESTPTIKEIEEVPASLLDLYLDCLTNLDSVPSDVQEPYWPKPPEQQRSMTAPPVKESLFLNPNAPVFTFQSAEAS